MQSQKLRFYSISFPTLYTLHCTAVTNYFVIALFDACVPHKSNSHSKLIFQNSKQNTQNSQNHTQNTANRSNKEFFRHPIYSLGLMGDTAFDIQPTLPSAS